MVGSFGIFVPSKRFLKKSVQRDTQGSMGVVVGFKARAELCLGVAALLCTFACTGVMGEGAPQGGPEGSSGAGGGGGSSGGAPPTPTNPGRGAMHRLNTNEYNYTVADVLGTALHPADSNWRGGEIDGFDNIASQLGVDDTQYTRYFEAAEVLADDVFASPTLKARFVTCSTADDAACVQDFASRAGLRIFRRPLRQTELTRYQALYTNLRQQGQDHDGSLKHLLWAMLSSAEFLYRIELSGKGVATQPLDGFELATRLSYFLWSSAPDEALLEAASQSALQSDEQVKAAFDRLVDDGKSNRMIEGFVGQWLGGRKVVKHPVAPGLFNEWTPLAAEAATNEMYSYFYEFLHGNRSWLDFLKSDVNYVNDALAPVYGMTGVTGPALQRFENGSDQRAGFLGLAGFLALSSMDRRTSPTLRGKWVLLNILCTEPPPPPPDIPKLEATGKDLDTGNIRDALALHRTRPDCNACHGLFDPFGLALENYDAIGRYRASYADGSPVDAKTELGVSAAYPNGVKFEGISGAADAVTGSPQYKACIAHKLFTYGLGRVPSGQDPDWIHLLQHDWESGDLTVRRLMQELVLSAPFRNSGDVK
jgi:hypothetical protein